MMNLTRRQLFRPHFIGERFAWLVRAWPAIQFVLVWALAGLLLYLFWSTLIGMVARAWGG